MCISFLLGFFRFHLYDFAFELFQIFEKNQKSQDRLPQILKNCLTNIQIVAVGLAFVYVEGYGTNPAMPTHPAMLLFDAIYWSFTLVLGVADKQVYLPHHAREPTRVFGLKLTDLYRGYTMLTYE